jgi:hypothetical protein
MSGVTISTVLTNGLASINYSVVPAASKIAAAVVVEQEFSNSINTATSNVFII